jgi:hypothetical protein
MTRTAASRPAGLEEPGDHLDVGRVVLDVEDVDDDSSVAIYLCWYGRYHLGRRDVPRIRGAREADGEG